MQVQAQSQAQATKVREVTRTDSLELIRCLLKVVSGPDMQVTLSTIVYMNAIIDLLCMAMSKLFIMHADSFCCSI